MYCPKCGAKILEGAAFCGQCGTSLQENPPIPERMDYEQDIFAAAEPTEEKKPSPDSEFNQTRATGQDQSFGAQPSAYGTKNQPQYSQPIPIKNYDPSKDYTPIGMWGYFGYQILFAIPILGFILILIFSFGGTRNINLRNYARSTFCLFIVIAALAFVVLLVGLMIALTQSSL